MFPRARDPDVFPLSVSQWSVTIPADVAPDPLLAGLALPASLEPALPKRKIEFLAGRVCAREAIRRLAPTAADGALPRDADGCPVWPSGFVGAISHTDGFATAVVARGGAARGIGVDVEPVMERAAAAEIEGLVAAAAELRLARDAGLDALASLTLVFSAKESLFKALYPATRWRFDYHDCALVRVDAATRRFSIRLAAPSGAPPRVDYAGRWELAEGEVRTGVLIA